MRGRRTATVENRVNAAPLFQAAAFAYAANCALGTAVAARIVDTRRFRWLHHVLYITTCTAVAAALSSVFWGRPRRPSRQAALALAPAAVPLVAIAFTRTHSPRHPLVALAAAPFFAAGLLYSRRPVDRK